MCACVWSKTLCEQFSCLCPRNSQTHSSETPADFMTSWGRWCLSTHIWLTLLQRERKDTRVNYPGPHPPPPPPTHYPYPPLLPPLHSLTPHPHYPSPPTPFPLTIPLIPSSLTPTLHYPPIPSPITSPSLPPFPLTIPLIPSSLTPTLHYPLAAPLASPSLPNPPHPSSPQLPHSHPPLPSRLPSCLPFTP